jgi:hypothetical protein
VLRDDDLPLRVSSSLTKKFILLAGLDALPSVGRGRGMDWTIWQIFAAAENQMQNKSRFRNRAEGACQK